MNIALQGATPNASVEPHSDRGGIRVQFAAQAPSMSPVWDLGGFELQFVQLRSGDSLQVEPESLPVYLKVITGEIDCAPYQPFPPAGAVASTRLDADTVGAVQDSVLCLVRETERAASVIHTMEQVSLRGPLEEHLGWQTFAEKFAGVTDIFDGLEAHMVPGFHLIDDAGVEIAYVHFWTTGKGVDVSTHNHGHTPSEHAPAFAEVHLVLRNGTGGGAMYQCEAPGAPERARTPIQAGEEHGPFFAVDPKTGSPKLRPNGAVEYPWHGWQGGDEPDPKQRYDLVAAFEINPNYVRIQ